MDKSKISGQTVICFILGVIVGIIIMSLLPGGSPDTGTNTGDGAATGESAMVGGVNLSVDGVSNNGVDRGEPVVTRLSHVSVANQPFGTTVVVTNIALNRTTWVAVKEELPTGAGNLLGARRLPAGLHDNTEVELLRSTALGGQYAVLLYEDDGDLVFDHKTDWLVTELGQPVVVRFTATGR